MPTLSPNKITITKLILRRPGDDASEWRTTLFNCECHTFDEVIAQICKAIGCSSQTASSLANIAHHTGQVKVCDGSREYCETVCDILGSIGLRASATD
jgi:ATP-dependent Clp protease adapter protein ClpS